MRKFSRNELAEYNGEDKSAYIAYEKEFTTCQEVFYGKKVSVRLSIVPAGTLPTSSMKHCTVRQRTPW